MRRISAPDFVCRSRGHSCGFSSVRIRRRLPFLLPSSKRTGHSLYQLLESYYELPFFESQRRGSGIDPEPFGCEAGRLGDELFRQSFPEKVLGGVPAQVLGEGLTEE